ncbi:MAG: tetratricopeptide repeat protein [Bacteroidetes bacterium]|nr:tetratricopeptide repeat protein [Bacteroidota bacterium]MBU1719483.1 tetratricopeptide repeat protein [Bacteroidota bacterium]
MKTRTDQEKHDWIEAYLLGKLKDSERKEFEQMLNDPEFANEVAIHKLLISGIRQFSALEMKEKLREIEKSMNARPFVVRWIIAHQAAAAVLLLFAATAVFAFFTLNNSIVPKRGITGKARADSIMVVSHYRKISNENDTSSFRRIERKNEPNKLYASVIFDEYYQPPQNYLTEKSRSSEIPVDSLMRAMYYFNEQEYEKAAPILGELNTKVSHKDKPGVEFYLAICALETGKMESAITLFQWVSNSGDPVYKDLAIWYLGLSFLKKNDTKQARETFAIYTKLPGKKKIEAEKILIRLIE